MTRNETIKIIRAALKRRSGRSWSVTGGRGAAYGWINIDAPPARQTWRWDNPRSGTNPEDYTVEINDREPDCGHTGPADREELAALLGLEHRAYFQGVSIPAASDYYQEYIDRAEGRTPARHGERYWD